MLTTKKKIPMNYPANYIAQWSYDTMSVVAQVGNYETM